MTSKGGGGKEQRENPNAIKGLPHRERTTKRDDTNSLDSCTCRGPQNTFKQKKKPQKRIKTLFKGAYASFTTDGSRVIRRLTS